MMVYRAGRLVLNACDECVVQVQAHFVHARHLSTSTNATGPLHDATAFWNTDPSFVYVAAACVVDSLCCMHGACGVLLEQYAACSGNAFKMHVVIYHCVRLLLAS